MSSLVLVRHGQAHAFEADSDRLTPLGEEQARRLGEYWVRQEVAFDAVYRGTLLRHRQTCELAAAAFRAAPAPWPEPVERAALNEYNVNAILHLAPGDLYSEWQAHRDDADRNRYFQRVLEAAMKLWLEGRISQPGLESWADFRGRVTVTLQEIMRAHGGGQRVAVFTSGGPIGVTVQTVMHAPESSAVEVNWRVRNGSLTEIVYGGGRATLDGFNLLPHLEDRRLWSWR